MSLVIGIKEKGKVILACDSQVTIGGVKKTSALESNFKIWHPDKHSVVLMGSVGTVRQMNVIKHTDNIIEELKILQDKVDHNYVVNKVVKKILATLKDNNVITTKDNILLMDNSYLLAVKDRLYQIYSDGAVIEIDDFTAIGSGSNEAIASLNTTRGIGTPKERVINAVNATVMNDIFVNYPVVVSDTTRKDFDIIRHRIIKKGSDKIGK